MFKPFWIQVNRSGSRQGWVYATIVDGEVKTYSRSVARSTIKGIEYKSHRHMLDVMFEIRDKLGLDDSQVKYAR